MSGCGRARRWTRLPLALEFEPLLMAADASARNVGEITAKVAVELGAELARAQVTQWTM
jgi:hypothetical protein